MACTRRIRAWRSHDGGPPSFKDNGGELMYFPCGWCMDCRLRRSRDWALRMMHESQEHEASCFITLTFDQAHLPDDLSLSVRTWQLFLKRLRKRLEPRRIRFFACGEYGERTLRPHYHAVLFGVDFHEDRTMLKRKNGYPLFVSPTLASVWRFGLHSIGALTFDSAAYVARYVTKKIRGSDASEHYTRVDAETGETWEVLPEFATMSRGGRSGERGIGYSFFEKYTDEMYNRDEVVSAGRLFPPPRYYDALLSEQDPERYEDVCFRRRDALGSDHRDRECADRSREKVLAARLKLHKGAVDSS